MSGPEVSRSWRAIRGVCVAAVAAVLALWLAAPPPAAATQPLETLTVDAGKPTVTTGSLELKRGTKYELHVSGTFTVANGYGQTSDEDALYCFGDSGFVSPQCQPPRRDGYFFLAVGTSKLQEIDAYQEPGGGGSPVGYSISHTYIVNFYPPADGKLTAGALNAFTKCKVNKTPCTTTIVGTMTIEIFGPGAGGGGGGQSPVAFVPPATGWGLPTAMMSLRAGLGAVVVSPPLAKGQSTASATVAGTGTGRTEPELALERAQIVQCIYLSLALSVPEKKPPKITYHLNKVTKLMEMSIEQVKQETPEETGTNFLLTMMVCLSEIKSQPAHANPDATSIATAAACPVQVARLRVKELDLKQVRYGLVGPGRTPGLTTTCSRTPTGLTVQLHSHGTDLRSMFGPRLVLGLYQPTGTATAQVTFGNGAPAPPPPPPPPAPSFTGNWNTSFGLMHLTQSGNSVTGTYAICNGTATISGQVTGSTLDGTWTEPCDSGQGRIQFVLSADGNSFTGLWGVGTATPTGAWNGTRAP